MSGAPKGHRAKHSCFSSLYYYFGLGDLLREKDELEAAEQHLAQGMALVKETMTVEPFVALLGYTTLARWICQME